MPLDLFFFFASLSIFFYTFIATQILDFFIQRSFSFFFVTLQRLRICQSSWWMGQKASEDRVENGSSLVWRRKLPDKAIKEQHHFSRVLRDSIGHYVGRSVGLSIGSSFRKTFTFYLSFWTFWTVNIATLARHIKIMITATLTFGLIVSSQSSNEKPSVILLISF